MDWWLTMPPWIPWLKQPALVSVRLYKIIEAYMIHSVYYQCDYWWLYCIYTHLWPRKKVHSWNRNLQSLRPWPCRKSTEVQRVGEFDPLRREVEVNKPFNMCVCVQRGSLIPYEEKWKLTQKTIKMFVQRGWGFDPLWREVEVKKPFNILVQRGWGFDPLWREVEVNKPFNSTYLFREGGGFDPLWRLDSASGKRPC